MIGIVRQLFGLLIVAALGATFYIAISSASRSRLDAAHAEFERISKLESALLGRLEDNPVAHDATMILPPELIWNGEDAAVVEIAIQQQMLDAANEAGLQVMAFGVAAPAEGITQPTIGYEVELEGGHVEVARLLSLLEDARPGLAIGNLWMRQLPPMDGVAKAPISVRLTAWGFRNAIASPP
jgi:Type II secretion system (T2SS), protein M subtype b